MKSGPISSFSNLRVLIALILLTPLYMVANPSPVSAQSSDTFGAIYFDENERVFGASSDHSDLAQAERVPELTSFY